MSSKNTKNTKKSSSGSNIILKGINRSEIYSLEGKLDVFKGKNPYKVPFVRKMIDKKDPGGKIELFIAKQLQKKPQENIVDVLKVSDNSTKPDEIYIDYQKLDVSKSFRKSKKELDDIRNGLRNLHELDVIYIDLKEDNLGYDKISKEWRVFDFDTSGVSTPDKLEWKMKPELLWAHRKITDACDKKENLDISKMCKKKTLIRLDEIIFNLEFGENLY